MFGNNSDILQVIQNQQESNLTLSQEITKMGKALEGIKEEMKKTLEGYKDETILLATYENTYRSEGFKFNSLYISDSAVQDSATLVIMYSGLSFTVPLVSGENILNIPDSATYKLVTTSGQNYTAILTRFNTQPAFLSKNTPGNVAVQNQSGTQFLGVNSDGSINTQTQLTGRNVKLIKKTQSLSTVNAGATVQLIFNSNPKTIAKIKYLGVYIAPPSGATTGTQRVYITLGTDTTYTAERIKDLGSVAFNQACLLASTDNGYPIRDLEFDSIVPLVITYVNSTDVIQNSASYIELVYEEEATV